MFILCILLTSLLFILPCFSTPGPTLRPRQDAETRTVDGFLISSVELQGGATTVIPSPTTPYRLETATAPIQLADTIGLIMPNPWAKVYAGESILTPQSQADDRSQLLAWVCGCRVSPSADGRWLVEADSTSVDVAQ